MNLSITNKNVINTFSNKELSQLIKKFLWPKILVV